MTGQERAVVGVIAAVMLLLLGLLLWPREAAAPAQSSRNAIASEKHSPERAPEHAEKQPVIPSPTREPAAPTNSTPPPEPAAPAESGEPPPITALILTFPYDMSEGEMDERIAKCKGIVVRRYGVYVKIIPDRGASYSSIKRCFAYTDVSVQEERFPKTAPQ